MESRWGARNGDITIPLPHLNLKTNVPHRTVVTEKKKLKEEEEKDHVTDENGHAHAEGIGVVHDDVVHQQGEEDHAHGPVWNIGLDHAHVKGIGVVHDDDVVHQQGEEDHAHGPV